MRHFVVLLLIKFSKQFQGVMISSLSHFEFQTAGVKCVMMVAEAILRMLKDLSTKFRTEKPLSPSDLIVSEKLGVTMIVM